MGMFSYACTKCGPKEQFDWSNQCVLKVGDVYVTGRYDAYGSVNVKLAGQADATVTVMHTQFLQYRSVDELVAGGNDSSHDTLLATEIYCDGDGPEDKDEKDPLYFPRIAAQQTKDLMSLLRGYAGDDDSSEGSDNAGSDRHCVPDRVHVLDSLEASMLEKLPKAASAKRMATDNNNNNNNNKKRKTGNSAMKGDTINKKVAA